MSVVDELAALIGRPGALAMCSVWGGSRFYVPRSPASGSAIVALLGELQAAKLAKHYAGGFIDLPAPPVAEARRIEAKRLRAEGYLMREVAERLDISEKWARKLVLE